MWLGCHSAKTNTISFRTAPTVVFLYVDGTHLGICRGLPHSVLRNLNPYIDGLVQDCSNSSALAMELLQSCTKPLIYQSNLNRIKGINN